MLETTLANAPSLVLRTIFCYLPYARLLRYASVNRCWSQVVRQLFWSGRTLRFSGHSLARFRSLQQVLEDSEQVWPTGERIGDFCRVLWLECEPSIGYENVVIPDDVFRSVLRLLPNLRCIWTRMYLTSDMLNCIGEYCQRLVILFIQRLRASAYGLTTITEECLTVFLAKCRTLERFYLTFSPLKDSISDSEESDVEINQDRRRERKVIPKTLTIAQPLTALRRFYFSFLSVDSVRIVTTSAPNITDLRMILSPTMVDDESTANVLNEVSEKFTKLEIFSLMRVQSSKTVWGKDVAWFPRLLKNNPNLLYLTVAADLHIGSNSHFDQSVSSLTDEALRQAGDFMGNLRFLRLHHHSQITDVGVQIISDHAKRLECMFLEQIAITDHSLNKHLVALRLPYLRHLSIGSFQYPENPANVTITPNAVWNLLSHFDRVSYTGRPFVTDAASLEASSPDQGYYTEKCQGRDGKVYFYLNKVQIGDENESATHPPPQIDEEGNISSCLVSKRLTWPPCTHCEESFTVIGDYTHQYWFWQNQMRPTVLKLLGLRHSNGM